MNSKLPFLQAALNGAREHPATPRSPGELADEAHASVEAGASSLHMHPFDDRGMETLEAEACARALRAVREVCPGVTISLSTSAEIEPDPQQRLKLIDSWMELPDLVSVNQGERGVDELMDLLLSKGIEVEAGLLRSEDAHAFVRSKFASRCRRVLVEPLDAEPRRAVAHAAAMERVLADAGIGLDQVHHGDGIASWAVNQRGARRGHGIRTGLEDTGVLPDGRLASGNGELVLAAAKMSRAEWKRRAGS